jgi:hypothetical protein
MTSIRIVYTVGDLRTAPAKTMQYCWICGGEWSATYGDYFMRKDDDLLLCCDQPVALVTKRAVYTTI